MNWENGILKNSCNVVNMIALGANDAYNLEIKMSNLWRKFLYGHMDSSGMF